MFETSAQVSIKLDTTFHVELPAETWVDGILPLSDGRIIISGGTYTTPGLPPWGGINWMRRILPNGTIDPTFNPDARGYGGLQPWGDRFYANYGGLKRFTIDGYVDPTFPPLVEYLEDWIVLDDGGVLVAGDVTPDSVPPITNFGVVKLDTTGAVDMEFNYATLGGSPRKFFRSSSGQLFVFGFFAPPLGPLVKIDQNGNLDPSFSLDPLIGGVTVISDLVEQPDGRLVITGKLGSPLGGDPLNIVRLEANGLIDPSFNSDHTWTHQGVYNPNFTWSSVELLPDGHIMASGLFQMIDGSPRNGVAIFDEHGDLTDDLAGAGCLPFLTPNSSIPYLTFSNTHFQSPVKLLAVGSFHGFSDGTITETSHWSICRLIVESYPGVGFQEHTEQVKFDVFPNPSNGRVELRHHGAPLNDARLQVLDALGRQVYTSTINGLSQGRSVALDLAGLPSGTYIAHLIADGVEERVRFVIRH